MTTKNQFKHMKIKKIKGLVKRHSKLVSESFLIVFSVLLALFLNQVRETIKENRECDEALVSILTEVDSNYSAIENMYQLHSNILRRTDSILAIPSFEDSLFYNNRLNFDETLVDGKFLQEFITDASWYSSQNTGVLKPLSLQYKVQLQKLYGSHKYIDKSLDFVNNFFFKESIYIKNSAKQNMLQWRNMVKMLVNQERYLLRFYDEFYRFIGKEKTVKEEPKQAFSFSKTLSLQNISFSVTTLGSGSVQQLTIKPQGLTIDNKTITEEIYGQVVNAEVEDLNSDGYPELLIYVVSAGSGSYGSVIGYSVNAGKSVSKIYFPEISENPQASKGYMGHDEFAIVETSLVQRFRIYNPGDANCCPTGDMRQVTYKLVDGEAGRKFVVNKIDEYAVQ